MVRKALLVVHARFSLSRSLSLASSLSLSRSSSIDSWLITQAVHIGLYGFFYRTAGGQGGRGSGTRGDGDDVVDIRPIASFFLLAYALLCSLVATRIIGGTVAASALAVDGNAAIDDGVDDSCGDGSTRNDLVIQAISSYEVTAAGATDAEAGTGPPARTGSPPPEAETPGAASSASSRGAGFSHPGRGPPLKPDGGGEAYGSASLAAATLVEEAGPARQESLRRGLKAYMRLTVGMMVGGCPWGLCFCSCHKTQTVGPVHSVFRSVKALKCFVLVPPRKGENTGDRCETSFSATGARLHLA